MLITFVPIHSPPIGVLGSFLKENGYVSAKCAVHLVYVRQKTDKSGMIGDMIACLSKEGQTSIEFKDSGLYGDLLNYFKVDKITRAVIFLARQRISQ